MTPTPLTKKHKFAAHNLFMKHWTLAIILLFCIPINASAQTDAQVKSENITTIANLAGSELQSDPGNREKWIKLHNILKVFYQDLTVQERQVYRELLTNTVQSSITVATSPEEPGGRISINGHISNLNGEPYRNVLLVISSTDSHGYYTPWDSVTRKLNEPDARIMGFLRTDNRGNFEILTTRPASYPMLDNGRVVPAHIHLQISAPGLPKKRIQALFDDDPALDDYWRPWAAREEYPIMKLEKNEKGVLAWKLNFILKN